MRVVQNGGRPERRRPRVGVEPPEVQTAGGPVLVVAGDQACPPLGELLDAGDRGGPVSDHIAQAQNGGGAADGEMVEDDGQSLEVRVDIRKNRVPDRLSPDYSRTIVACGGRVLSQGAAPAGPAPSPTRPNAALRAANGTTGTHCARPRK